MVIGGLAIVGTCLAIAVTTVVVFAFRPKARRRRRHRRSAKRPRIDLFAQPHAPPPEPDA
ncbi:MAG TPA: hypothetical protein VF605_11030 [Allosphingosinicella sp.]